MVPLDIGSALGGGSEEEFKGVPHPTCDPALISRIPDGIEKIHCDINLEKALDEFKKAIWPETFPDIEDFIDLFKDFSVTSIQEFITKAITKFMTGGVSGAVDAVSGLLGGKKYDKIEPVCLEAFMDRGDECQCNLHPGVESTIDGSKEEFVMEVSRKFPPMLLMPTIDAGLLRFIINLLTISEDESSSNDEIKLQIIWCFLKFKEYMGYQDGTPVPVPNVFNGAEKTDRNAHLDHYHWYNMEILDKYMVQEDVTAGELVFIDKFFDFTEIKQRISGVINNISEKPLYEEELIDQLFEQINNVFQQILQEIPVDFEFNFDQIKSNFFPAPKCGELLERFGISPDTMFDGGVVPPDEKAGIIAEVIILQILKLAIHEVIFKPMFSDERTDHIEVLGAIISIIAGIVPIYYSDNKGVQIVMNFVSAVLSFVMIILKIGELVAEGTKLAGADTKKIAEYIFKIFVSVIFIFDKIAVIITNIGHLYLLFTDQKPKPEEIKPEPKGGKKTEKVLKIFGRYIAFDLLNLEQAYLLLFKFLPELIKNIKGTGSKEELIESIDSLRAPIPTGFMTPWGKGKKQTFGGLWGESFFRNLLDFVALEILVEVILGFIKVVLGALFSLDANLLHPKQVYRRYRNNAANFFGQFIDPVVVGSVTNVTDTGVTINGEVEDKGTSEKIDKIIIEWKVSGDDTTLQSQEFTGDYKEGNTVAHNITNLQEGVTYNYRIKAQGTHKIIGVVEPVRISEPAWQNFTTTGATPPPATPLAINTNDADEIETDKATLNGELTGLGDETEVEVSFEWGPSSDDLSNKTVVGNLNSTEPFNLEITELDPDTTYYFKAVAEGTETIEGNVIDFSTPPLEPPEITTGDAGDIESDKATLNGELTGLGTASEVDVLFEWGESSGDYPNQTDSQKLNSRGTFQVEITGLIQETTYYFRVKAVGDDTVFSSENNFDTIKEIIPPDVITDGPSDIKVTSVNLDASIAGMGSAESVKASFEWGTSSGKLNKETNTQDMTEPEPFSIKLSGLKKGTTYYFRAKVVGDDTAFGEEKSVKTKSK